MVSRTGGPALLFVVDGMRPDAVQLAATPVLDDLMQRGATTAVARTVFPSITLPCHASLFLSTSPSNHGVTTNTWTSPSPRLPGIVEVLSEHGLRSAFFYNWDELRDLARPGGLVASLYPCRGEDLACDAAVAAAAKRWLAGNAVDFAFIYFGYVDIAGHDFGWMSTEYLDAIAHADACIGTVLDAVTETVLVAVTSDHGGHGHLHGTDCDEDLLVPLILAGPGIAPGCAVPRGHHRPRFGSDHPGQPGGRQPPRVARCCHHNVCRAALGSDLRHNTAVLEESLERPNESRCYPELRTVRPYADRAFRVLERDTWTLGWGRPRDRG